LKLSRLGPVFLALACIPEAVAQFGNCPSADAAKVAAKEAFQVTYEKQIGFGGYTYLFEVPPQQYAIVESVAIKGTHPANSYLAIELATLFGPTGHVFPTTNTPVPGGQPRHVTPLPLYARHFLYTKQSTGAVPIGIREITKIIAGPGTPVSIGLQGSAQAIEPLSVTLTGTFINRCLPVP
jgi:hypothetical protein